VKLQQAVPAREKRPCRGGGRLLRSKASKTPRNDSFFCWAFQGIKNRQRAAVAKSKKGFGKFWQSDWFVASVPALVLVWLASISNVLTAVENAVYDSAVVNSLLKPSDEVVLVTVDTASVESIGRWPWPRQQQAALIDAIASAKPKVIAPAIFYMEAQKDPGLIYIQKMKAALAADANPALSALDAQKIADEAQVDLDGDAKLAAVLKKAGNVVLAAPGFIGEPVQRPDSPLSGNVVKSFLNVKGVAGVPLRELQLVLPKIGDQSAIIAPIGLIDQSSGMRREDATLYEFFGNPVLPFSFGVDVAQKRVDRCRCSRRRHQQQALGRQFESAFERNRWHTSPDLLRQ
jgi:CHASE2 domain